MPSPSHSPPRPPSQPHPQSPQPPADAIEYIAHRGAAARLPENTIPALTYASHISAFDAVEFDVRRCGSGELVVIHDATIDRVTDGTGRVAALSYQDLQSFTVHDSDAHIPRLPAVLAALPDDTRAYIELKEPGLAADVLAAIEAAPTTLDTVITSFSPTALAELAEHDPTQACGLAFTDTFDTDTVLQLGQSFDCSVLLPHLSRCRSSDIGARAHNAGFDVIAWGANATTPLTDLPTHDIDGVTLDDLPAEHPIHDPTARSSNS